MFNNNQNDLTLTFETENFVDFLIWPIYNYYVNILQKDLSCHVFFLIYHDQNFNTQIC